MGASGVIFYIGNFGHRHFLFGPDGIVGTPKFEGIGAVPSYWNLLQSATAIDVVYILSLVIALGFMLIGGRTLSVLFAISIFCTYSQNIIILNGGNNMIQLVMLFTPFLITDAYLSPLSQRRWRKLEDAHPAVMLTHNLAVVLTVAQVAIIYFSASAWKWTSSQWRNGSALYYALNQEDFDWMPALTALSGHPIIGRLMTWSILAIQTSFLPLVLLRKHAYLVVGAVALMHVGIILGMGLVDFGVAMIAGDLLCATDRHYRAVIQRGEKVAQAVIARVRPSPA